MRLQFLEEQKKKGVWKMNVWHQIIVFFTKINEKWQKVSWSTELGVLGMDSEGKHMQWLTCYPVEEHDPRSNYSDKEKSMENIFWIKISRMMLETEYDPFPLVMW